MIKKTIIEFLYKNDTEKNKTILPILFLTNLIFFFPGEMPNFFIIPIMINIFILIPIIIPIVIILPFVYESKKKFLFYLYFITNIYNIFWLAMITYNYLFNMGIFLILIPFIIGIIFAYYMLKLNNK